MTLEKPGEQEKWDRESRRKRAKVELIFGLASDLQSHLSDQIQHYWSQIDESQLEQIAEMVSSLTKQLERVRKTQN